MRSRFEQDFTMTKDIVTAKLSCMNCGGVAETVDHPTDDSIVRCKSCGQIFGTYSEVKIKAFQTSKDEVISRVRKTSVGTKRVTIKTKR